MKTIIIILLLIIIFSGCIGQTDVIPSTIEAITENDTITHKNTYINASSIVSSGVTEDAGNSVSDLHGFNGNFWGATENLSVPWSITVEFYNVTHFDTIEAVHKYNSSGVPSSHIVTRYIWCEFYNDWLELEEFSTENNWYYKTVRFSEDDHFIMANGTVRIKYDYK